MRERFDVDESVVTALQFELHLTHRGVVDSLRYADFSDVFEVVGHADPPHPLYATGDRRCFAAIK
jgi:hypothetical protein